MKKLPDLNQNNEHNLIMVFIMRKIFLISVTGLLWLSLTGFCQEQKFHFNENGQGILLTYGNQNIFFYQKRTKSLNGQFPRANYIHPLYGLSGEILTEDFPDDHLHHRGIFWAWHQLYIKNERTGDGWECKGISWDITKTEYQAFNDSARLIAWVTWKGIIPGESSDSPSDLIHEKTIISCYRQHVDQSEIRFDIRLTPLYDGTLLGGSEDVKGYSGFSIRTKLPDDLSFYSSQGKVTPLETAIQAGGWIDMQGTFDPDLKQQTALTLMCDPKDPVPFHGWILRDKGSMQNAAFPGTTPVAIPKGETLRMQYEIFLHPEEMDRGQIESVYNRFIKDKN
jgi:hypothetical protein